LPAGSRIGPPCGTSVKSFPLDLVMPQKIQTASWKTEEGWVWKRRDGFSPNRYFRIFGLRGQ